jgi:alkaline phosphatase
MCAAGLVSTVGVSGSTPASVSSHDGGTVARVTTTP